METFQTIKTFERDNEVSQGVDASLFNDSITEQVEKFDNNYSDEKIKELTREFDSITINEDVLSSITMTEDNVLTEEKLSFRTKLYMGFAISVTALLLFLAIFNIIRINAVSGSIQLLESNIATETSIYNSLQNDVDSLNDLSGITAELGNLGYYEMTNDDMIQVDISNETPVVALEGSTNWFDSVCNFISSIFGG